MASEYGLTHCNTVENKASILQNLNDLDSLIFDEYELRLNSIDAVSNETEYSNLRLNYDSLKTKLIDVFGAHYFTLYFLLKYHHSNHILFHFIVKQRQIENAMKLAEKYVDFSTLVSICEIKSDTELLATYLDKFKNSVIVFDLIRVDSNCRSLECGFF